MTPIVAFFLGLAVIPVLAVGYALFWYWRMGKDIAK